MRMLKNEPGDWVAVPMPLEPGGQRPGRVTKATRDHVVVAVRFAGREVELAFEEPLPRIVWSRERGRARWRLL
jgi:hypothetical protein